MIKKSFSIARFHITFTLNFKMLILTCIGLTFFITLGVWQLHRATEKKIREQNALIQSQKPLTNWIANTKEPSPYQPIKVIGHFLDIHFLWDNQHEQHQIGYHVVTPFELDKKHYILIDRGFIPRENLTHITTPKNKISLQGTVYYPIKNKWIHDESLQNLSNKKIVIQEISPKNIQHFLQKELYPFIMRLDEKEPFGYIRHWTINNMRWQRHLGYAIQWFLFAFITFILFLTLNTTYEKK